METNRVKEVIERFNKANCDLHRLLKKDGIIKPEHVYLFRYKENLMKLIKKLENN